MRFKKNTAIICLAVTLITCLAGCNNTEQTVNPNGEIEISEEIDRTDVDSEQQMPVYDYQNLPTSNPLSSEEYTSYYSRQLSERNKICYDEIYNAASAFQTEVVLSKSISPEALKQIMHIIYLDTPELYMLETDYSYDTDSNGNVYKVFLKYAMTKSDYDEVESVILQTIVNSVSEFKYSETEYEAEMQIANSMESHLYTSKLNEVEYFSGKNKASSFFTMIRNNTGDHLAYAKTFTYFCRRCGIDSAVVVGELTNTDYAKKIGIDIGEYKGLGGAINETVNGTHVDVSIDYSSFYAWSIVKLNDEWYHVDLLFPKQWKETYGEEAQNTELKDLRTTFNVDDYTISQSRLFYINEEILGLAPECNSKTFQALYRSGNYFLNYTSGQMNIAVTQKLDALVEAKDSQALYQFGSEDTYEIFMDKFDQIVSSYNENNGNVIQNYRIIENKETLSVFITDLIYY